MRYIDLIGNEWIVWLGCIVITKYTLVLFEVEGMLLDLLWVRHNDVI